MRHNDDMLKDIVKNAVRTQAAELLRDSIANAVTTSEAFVAQPKPAPQVTEFVTQRTKDAHDTLYKGYVEAFNRISAALDSVDLSTADPRNSTHRSLKVDEAKTLNALWLHELFFANCFDPNSNVYMNSIAFLKLQEAFGSFDDWQRCFMACAASVGQGWAVCGYHTYLRQYVNTFITEHSQDVMVGLIPLIVLDCHEHASRDYLNDRKSYVVAMMREFNWETINARFEKAEAIAKVVRQ
jgi:Fe-Mn family superoxide dismutase